MYIYTVIYNKNGSGLQVIADGYKFKDNMLIFEIYDKGYRPCACFNLNNIIGFYKVKQ